MYYQRGQYINLTSDKSGGVLLHMIKTMMEVNYIFGIIGQ